MSGESAILEAFGGEPAAEAESKPESEPESKPESKPEDGRPEWAPEEYWKDGAVQTEAMAKGYRDLRADYTRKAQRLAELEKKGKVEIPKEADSYLEGLPWDALAEKHPRAAAAMGEKGAASPMVEHLLRSAHANGVPPDTAQAMLATWLEAVDPHSPEVLTQAERHKAAVGELGPLGVHIARDVSSWLVARNERKPFTEPQMAEITRLAGTAAGVSVLYELMREGGEGPPAVKAGSSVVDRTSQRQHLEKLLTEPDRGDGRWDEAARIHKELYGEKSNEGDTGSRGHTYAPTV